MKTKYFLIFGLILIGLFLVYAFFISINKIRSVDITGITFQELCEKNNDMWMKMNPWKDGKKVSDEMCFGCMIGENHFCTVQEYVGHIEDIQSSKMQDKEQMSMMNHNNTMSAHAGNNNNIDIYKYSVQFITSNISTGSNTELTFIIKDKESNKPISNLEVVHDKIMHIILVRKDLKYFDHIHPIQKEMGAFSVPYSFYAPGDYRIWIDFTIDGMEHIIDFDTTVSGTSEVTQPDSLNGLKVNIKTDNVKIGKPTKLEFIITDSSNKPVPITEKFLAANAHMIVIDESLDEFKHVHDMKFDKDNVISFEHVFENAGMHKLWIQFSVNGKTITKEFEVKVE